LVGELAAAAVLPALPAMPPVTPQLVEMAVFAMAAVAAVAVASLAEVVAVRVFASSGPVAVANSHQQTQETYNAKLFWNLERHRAISSACSEHLAQNPRRSHHWDCYGWRVFVRVCCFYGPFLCWGWPFNLPSCFYPRLHF
jgi:hypothetical protein